MSYKNSMKLFASNFALVWKQLLYLICCLFLFTLCSYPVVKPVISLLKESGIGEDFSMLFKSVYSSPNQFAFKFSEISRTILKTIFDNFKTIWPNLIGGAILCGLIPFVLIQMSNYNISSILYQKFSMNMDVSYVQNAMQTFSQSLKFALANILLNLPFVALIIVFIELYLVIATTFLSSIVGLVILSALSILVISIKVSIFSYYTSYMVENNSDPFVAFGKGLTQVLKNFWKILSISIILILTIIFVNGFIALFTFFAGLIVTIPATFVLIATYNLVTYFNLKGTRYYLSSTIIFNPVKHIVKKDDFVSTFVPEEVKEIQVTTTKIKKKYKKNKSEKNKQSKQK